MSDSILTDEGGRIAREHVGQMWHVMNGGTQPCDFFSPNQDSFHCHTVFLPWLPWKGSAVWQFSNSGCIQALCLVSEYQSGQERSGHGPWSTNLGFHQSVQQHTSICQGNRSDVNTECRCTLSLCVQRSWQVHNDRKKKVVGNWQFTL